MLTRVEVERDGERYAYVVDDSGQLQVSHEGKRSVYNPEDLAPLPHTDG